MSETIQDTQTRLAAFILENNPNADVGPGTVLSELVVKLAATAQNGIYNDVQALEAVSAVQTALASTVPTYTIPLIDNIASNFLTTRYQGKVSGGILKVTVAAGNRGYTIPSGTLFVQPTINLQYQTSQTYTVVTGTPGSSTELPLLTDGTTFYFLLPVSATAAGSQYQVSSGASFSVVGTSNLSNIVSIVSYGAFTSGLPQDSDQVLLAKMQTNITNLSLTSSKAIAATILQAFPDFQSLSSVGANDAEMMRSKRNFCGVSTFGKADIYVRTSVGVEQVVIQETATKVSAGVWQLNIGATDAPGFYQITSLLPTPVNNTTVMGTLPIKSITFGYSQDQFPTNNEIDNATDARFSCYQTATVQFAYSEVPSVAPGATASMDVAVNYMPNLSAIQTMFQAEPTRILCGDYLVRGAIPCFVSLNLALFKINPTDTEASINIPQMKQDIFNYVNTIPFGESLYASKIVEICHNYPIKRVDLPISMSGLIYGVDGSTQLISNSDVLTIPTNLTAGVTPKTTAYFIDYVGQNLSGNSVDNIGISLT